MSIKIKLIVAFLLVLVPFLLLQVWNILERNQSRTQAVLQTQVGAAQAVAAAMDAFLADVIRTEEVAGVTIVVDKTYSPDELNYYLSKVRAERPYIAYLALTTPEGQVYAADPVSLIGQDLAARPDVQAVLRGRPWTASNLELSWAGVTDVPAFRVDMGVRLEAKVLAVFVMGIEARSLGAILPGDLGQPGAVVLTDATGRVVYDSGHANPLQTSPVYGGGQVGADWSALPFIQEALRGYAGTSAGFTSPADGAAVMGAQVPITTLGWTAGVYRPVAEAMAPVRALALRDVVILGLATLLALGLALLLGNLLTRPIVRLTAHAARLSQGELDRRIDLHTGDEIGQLGEAFNQMATGLSHTIGELTQAKEEIAQKSRELQQVLARTHEITEEDRQRIALDIHDGVVQMVIGASYEVQAAASAVTSHRLTAQKHLETARRLLDQTVTEMRRIVFDLRPTYLDSLGLFPALEKYAQSFQESSGIACTATLQGEPLLLPDETKVAVYRIVQEALNNVRKHSGATAAAVQMAFAPGRLTVTVQDNGTGFATEAANAASGHLGLVSMAERAQSIGGRLDITSAPGQGTRLVLEVATGGNQ
jgi:signal transduction histidine kinase